MFRSALAPTRRGHDGDAQNTPVAVDLAKHDVLEPVAFNRGGSCRASPPGDDPYGGQVALLPEIRPQNPDVEIRPLDAAQPPLQYPQRGINRDGLVRVGGGARSNGTGVAGILP